MTHMTHKSHAQYEKDRVALALSLKAVGAILTKNSDHPRVVERDGPTGRERGFRLKHHDKNPEAPLSPIFLNLRTADNPNPGPLTPTEVHLAVDCMLYLAWHQHVECDAIAGVPNAGDPFAKELAWRAKKPHLRMNKETGSGKRRVTSLVSTDTMEGDIVLLVDDLITKAHSKKEAVDVLRQENLLVRDVLVLVDRQEGGREELLDMGYALHAVFTMQELLKLYVRENEMTPELYHDVLEYLGLPA